MDPLPVFHPGTISHFSPVSRPQDHLLDMPWSPYVWCFHSQASRVTSGNPGVASRKEADTSPYSLFKPRSFSATAHRLLHDSVEARSDGRTATPESLPRSCPTLAQKRQAAGFQNTSVCSLDPSTKTINISRCLQPLGTRAAIMQRGRRRFSYFCLSGCKTTPTFLTENPSIRTQPCPLSTRLMSHRRLFFYKVYETELT